MKCKYLFFKIRKKFYLKKKFYRILLEIDPNIAAKIVALRPSLEALIVRSCIHPETLDIKSEDSIEFIEILKQISSDLNWLPVDSNEPYSSLPNQQTSHAQQNYGENQLLRSSFNDNFSQYNSILINKAVSSTFIENENQHNESGENNNVLDAISGYNKESSSFSNNYINQRKLKL